MLGVDNLGVVSLISYSKYEMITHRKLFKTREKASPTLWSKMVAISIYYMSVLDIAFVIDIMLKSYTKGNFQFQ